MVQANVFTSASALAWQRDKARITTADEPVTYQVNILYGTPATGNLFSAPTSIPANWTQDIWIGVGNQLTVTGNCTIQEIGTTSSGLNAVR
jgi:hypothetical protein